MTTAAITKALESADRRLASIKRHKEALKIREERAYAAGAALVGAVIAGVADAKYRDADGSSKKVLKLPAVGLASGLLALGGISEYVPGGIYIGMLGVGGLCYVIGKAAHDHQAAAATT
jgi:hypothetical protein